MRQVSCHVEYKDLPNDLVEQLCLINVCPDLHAKLVAAAAGRVTNPTDSFGRTAIEVGMLRDAGFRISPACRCFECGELLAWRKGNAKVTSFFRHRAKTRCPGGFMTPWHAAMQTACAAAGFDTEYAVTVQGVRRRLDAYHAGTNICIEFVSSLSQRYAQKHRQLIEFPIQTAWFFNSGAHFATAAHEERVDVWALNQGVIRIQNLFSEDGGAREVVEEIGRKHCYTIHRGLVFGCVGFDLWECLPASHPLQELCVRDYGFNFQLYKFGKFPKLNLATGEPTGKNRVVRSRYTLPSGHVVDPEHLLEELRREVRTGKLKPASPLASTKASKDDTEVADSDCVKLPSDNDVVPCDGDKSRRNHATNNLAMAEVAEQLRLARAEFRGSEFRPWDDDRDTDVVVTATAVSPRREIRSTRVDLPTKQRKSSSLWNVNKELQIASSNSTHSSMCCSKRNVITKRIGSLVWDECVSCGAKSQSRYARKHQVTLGRHAASTSNVASASSPGLVTPRIVSATVPLRRGWAE